MCEQRPLDPVECWMVKQNLNYVQQEGLEVVLSRLREQGYYRIAAAVEKAVENEGHP